MSQKGNDQATESTRSSFRKRMKLIVQRASKTRQELPLYTDHDETDSQMPFKLVAGGFMTFWTKRYYDPDESRFYKLSWKFFAIFKLAMIIRIVKILSLYKQPDYAHLPLHVYLGTFGQYMGGPPHFTELIAFFWSWTESMMYLKCVCRPRRDFDWIYIFIYLDKDNVSSK